MPTVEDGIATLVEIMFGRCYVKVSQMLQPPEMNYSC